MKSRKVKAAEKWSRLKKNKPEEDDSRESSPDLDNLIEESSDESLADNEIIKDDDSEEEVLPISNEEESEEENEDDLPNRDAWGRKKSVYFNADFVDEDRGKTYREEDAELAKAEAEEALAIQRSVMSYVNASGLDRNILLKEHVEQADEDIEDNLENSTSLTKQEKLMRLKKVNPEFFTYNKDFKEKMLYIIEKLVPLFKEVENGRIPPCILADYVREKYHIANQYCLNIVSYMTLKSSGLLFPNHSVYHWLNILKERLDTLDEKYNISVEDIEQVLERLRESEEFQYPSTKPSKKKEKLSKKRKKMDTDATMQNEDLEDNSMLEEFIGDEKRTITYQIAKNKGLTARRKKELRNPRVHHRMKFRKAKIRRKGQVRESVREIKRYEGEPTGISTHVVKSVKFK